MSDDDKGAAEKKAPKAKSRRKPGKKKIGFWFTKAERELLEDLAARMGLTMTDAIRELMLKDAKQRGMTK